MELDNSVVLDFINESPQRNIFCYPWWLDAVAEDSWQYIINEINGNIEGIIPIVIRKKWGIKIWSMPPFTQSLGPLLPNYKGKYVTNLSSEHKALSQLIDLLPEVYYSNFRLHLSITNWLPFYWAGYSQQTRYTYVLNDIQDQKSLWNSMRSNIRREIRKAKKIVSVTDQYGVDELINLRNMTFDRQDKQPQYGRKYIERIVNVTQEHEQGKLLFAEDSQGNIHSGLLLVWDDRTAYYLIGGSDPELRTSGAFSLLLWEAIQFAGEKVKQFNFEGSMIESIERFFRAFGGKQVPYFKIFKFRYNFIEMLIRMATKSSF